MKNAHFFWSYLSTCNDEAQLEKSNKIISITAAELLEWACEGYPKMLIFKRLLFL